MATIAQRINEALNIRNMKQTDLVRATGIGKSSISTYLSGEYAPKQKNIYKIALALDVDEAWLMGYDVPMEKEKPIPASENGLDAEKLAFIEKLKDMDADTVAALNTLADSIIAKRKK